MLFSKSCRRYSILLIMVLVCLTVIVLMRLNSYFKPYVLQPQLHSPFQCSQTFENITNIDINKLNERLVFSQVGHGSVLQVSVSPDGCNILAIYQDGHLIRWSIEAKDALANFELGITSPKAVNFSSDGARLITPRYVTVDEKIIGVTVWDTTTGEDVFCDGNQIQCPNGDNWGEPKDGYLLDQTGQWLFAYSLDKIDNYAHHLSSINVQNIDTAYIPYNYYLSLSDKFINDANADLSMMGSDVKTEYIVYGFSNGMVRVSSRHSPVYSDNPSFDIDLLDGYSKEKVEIVDLAIDDTRTWLAVLRNDSLLVWNLQRGFFWPLSFRASIKGGNALVFDHNKQILAVGTENEILLYDLGKQNLSRTILAPGTTSIYMTKDNRLLISGDANGEVHIWAIE